MSNDFDLPIADLGDLDGVTQVPDTAFDLDAVVEELFESGKVEDLIADRLGGVDHELLSGFVSIIGDGGKEGMSYLPSS